MKAARCKGPLVSEMSRVDKPIRDESIGEWLSGSAERGEWNDGNALELAMIVS